jgi:hypothetical protein
MPRRPAAALGLAGPFFAVAATFFAVAAFARAGAVVVLAAFGADAFRGAVLRVAFFATAFAAGAGFVTLGAAFLDVAAEPFFPWRVLPGDGADPFRAPAFFLLLAIGGSIRPDARATRVCPAAGSAAGAHGS